MLRVKAVFSRRMLKYSVLLFLLLGLLLPAGQGPLNGAETDPAAATTMETDPAYYGAPGGAALRQSLQFSDLGASFWARDSILRVAAQGLLRGEGDGRFQPGKQLSRQEAVTGLVKALGLEKEALEAAPMGGGAQADTWAQGFVAMAIQEGILEPTEGALLNWTEPVTRQEMAVWLAKALKLTPRYGGEARTLARFADSGQVDAQAAPWIDPVLEEKLMAGVSSRRFDPQGALTRAQLAVILDKADPRLMPRRGTVESQGTIQEISRNAAFEQGYPVNQARVRVDSPDKVEWLVFQSPQRPGDANQAVLEKEAAVYSPAARRLGGSEMLKTGQRVRFLTDKNRQVFYVEILSSPSFQTVSGNIQEFVPADGRLVINSGGAATVLQLGDEVAVEVNGQPADRDDLLVGQEAEVSLSDGAVTAVRASMPQPNPGYLPPEQQVHYGRIIEVGFDTLRMLVNGREVEYSISPYTLFTRDNQTVRLEQVRPGDTAQVYLEDGLTPGVLRPGQVTPDPLQVSRVLLEGPEVQVVNVYRGRLEEYSPVSGELVLRETGEYHPSGGQYQQANWINQRPLSKMEIDSDTRIFLVGRQISLRELRRPEYRGHRVYAATRDDYGGPQVVHLALEPELANTFYDQIEEVNFGESWFKLGDVNLSERRIVWDDGTLVLHDGRLVGSSYLQEGQDVMVLASPFGRDYRAAVVLVEQPYHSSPRVDDAYLRFICGTVDDLSVDRIKLYDAYEWNQQSRTSIDDITLFLNLDTQVIDSSDPALPASLIDLNDLFARWGAEDADDQYVYLIAYGEQVLAVNIRGRVELPPSMARFRAGKVVSVRPNDSPPPQVEVVLDQVKDWVGLSDYWAPNPSTSVTVNFDRAQVVRQGRPNQPTLLQFRPNDSDRLSVLRRGDLLYWLEVPSDTVPPGNLPTPVLVIAESS